MNTYMITVAGRRVALAGDILVAMDRARREHQRHGLALVTVRRGHRLLATLSLLPAEALREMRANANRARARA